MNKNETITNEVKQSPALFDQPFVIYGARTDISTLKGVVPKGTLIKLFYREDKNGSRQLCFDVWNKECKFWVFEHNRYYGDFSSGKADFIKDKESLEMYMEQTTELEILTEQINTARKKYGIPSIIKKIFLVLMLLLVIIIIRYAITSYDYEDNIKLWHTITVMFTALVLWCIVYFIRKLNLRNMEEILIKRYFAEKDKTANVDELKNNKRCLRSILEDEKK